MYIHVCIPKYLHPQIFLLIPICLITFHVRSLLPTISISHQSRPWGWNKMPGKPCPVGNYCGHVFIASQARKDDSAKKSANEQHQQAFGNLELTEQVLAKLGYLTTLFQENVAGNGVLCSSLCQQCGLSNFLAEHAAETLKNNVIFQEEINKLQRQLYNESRKNKLESI